MKYKALLRTLICIQMISLSLSYSLPRIKSEIQSRMVYPIGSNVSIYCPVIADDTDLLFFEWSRPLDQPIVVNHRTRITDKGVLKIKSVIIEDSGEYLCKAINGFGSVTTSVVLEVQPIGYLETLNAQKDNIYPIDSFDSISAEDYKPQPKVSQRITGRQRGRNKLKPIVLSASVGESVNISCDKRVTGHRINWYKNSQIIYNSELSVGSHKSGRHLTLSPVRVRDSGLYTCVALDDHFNSSVNLVVYDKPKMTALHPINSTVVLGEPIVFYCNISSQVKPIIQWLKGMTDINEAIDESVVPIKLNLFKSIFNSEYYQVLKPSEVIDNKNDTYSTTYVIERTQTTDSGEYICLAVNPQNVNFDFIYESTYLRVQPVYPLTGASNMSNDSNVSLTAIFWISVSVVTAVVLFLVVFLICLNRKRITETRNLQNNINNDIEDSISVTDGANRYRFTRDSTPKRGYISGIAYNQMNQNFQTNRLNY